MPLINAVHKIKVGNKIEAGNISILMAIVGPIVQSKGKNYLPHIHTCYYNGHERVEGWTYREGPVSKMEIVTNTQTGHQTLWFGWR
jgi:hypothetical protein